MKTCPDHIIEYDETAGPCPMCARNAALAATSDDPIVAPVSTEETAADTDDVPAGIADPSDIVEAENDGEPDHRDAPRPVAPLPVDDTIEPAPAFETAAGTKKEAVSPDIGPKKPLPRKSPPKEPNKTVSTDDGSDESEDNQVFKRLIELRNKGVFTVLLLGFHAGGKTFFLSRLKALLRDRFTLVPGAPSTGDTIERSYHVTIHTARQGLDETGVDRQFAIIDIPGERLRRLIEGQFATVKSIVAAMEMCDAIIVALPADEVLLSERVARAASNMRGSNEELLGTTVQTMLDLGGAGDARLREVLGKSIEIVDEIGIEDALKEASELDRRTAVPRPMAGAIKKPKSTAAMRKERQLREKERQLREDALRAINRIIRMVEADPELRRFSDSLCFLAELAVKLRKEGVPITEEYDFASIDVQAITARIGATWPAERFRVPTFIALTKTDLVSHPDAFVTGLLKVVKDTDLQTRFAVDPVDTVRKYRADLAGMFASWYATHKFDFVTAFRGQGLTDRIDLSLDSYGVRSVMNWIFWIQDLRSKSPADLAALDRARAIRGWREGKQVIEINAPEVEPRRPAAPTEPVVPQGQPT